MKFEDIINFLLQKEELSKAAKDAIRKDPNLLKMANSNGITLFLATMYQGDEKLARELVSLGANVKAVDKLGNNALHYALFGGNGGLIKILTEEWGFSFVILSPKIQQPHATISQTNGLTSTATVTGTATSTDSSIDTSTIKSTDSNHTQANAQTSVTGSLQIQADLSELQGSFSDQNFPRSPSSDSTASSTATIDPANLSRSIGSEDLQGSGIIPGVTQSVEGSETLETDEAHNKAEDNEAVHDVPKEMTDEVKTHDEQATLQTSQTTQAKPRVFKPYPPDTGDMITSTVDLITSNESCELDEVDPYLKVDQDLLLKIEPFTPENIDAIRMRAKQEEPEDTGTPTFLKNAGEKMSALYESIAALSPTSGDITDGALHLARSVGQHAQAGCTYMADAALKTSQSLQSLSARVSNFAESLSQQVASLRSPTAGEATERKSELNSENKETKSP